LIFYKFEPHHYLRHGTVVQALDGR